MQSLWRPNEAGAGRAARAQCRNAHLPMRGVRKQRNLPDDRIARRRSRGGAAAGIGCGGIPPSKPRIHQRQIRRARRHQGDGEHDMRAFAGSSKGRSHGRKHRAILARESRGFFFGRFRTRLRLKALPPKSAPAVSRIGPFTGFLPAREGVRPGHFETRCRCRRWVGLAEFERCRMRCFAMTPS
jgi:hypothetical protein